MYDAFMPEKTKIHKNMGPDAQRLTFYLHFQMARQLRANAKQEGLSFPDYLAFLVQRGLAKGKAK